MIKTKNNGKIIITNKALKDIVDIVVRKVNGVIPTKKDASYVSITNKDYLDVLLHIKVKSGIDVNKLCLKLQEEIKDAVLSICNLECRNINIDIQGFELNKR